MRYNPKTIYLSTFKKHLDSQKVRLNSRLRKAQNQHTLDMVGCLRACKPCKLMAYAATVSADAIRFMGPLWTVKSRKRWRRISCERRLFHLLLRGKVAILSSMGTSRFGAKKAAKGWKRLGRRRAHAAEPTAAVRMLRRSFWTHKK